MCIRDSVTGEAAASFITGLSERLMEKTDVKITVYAIKNNFFGGGVNVSGLVTGGDIIDQLKDKHIGDIMPVSYTHLDVYKRQDLMRQLRPLRI